MTAPFKTFTVRIDAKAAREALFLLNRALNVLEPVHWPDWASPHGHRT